MAGDTTTKPIHYLGIYQVSESIKWVEKEKKKCYNADMNKVEGTKLL